MADFIGRDIDRYHIIEQLGQGGMAIVYKAYDTRLERDVAVKVIRRNAFSPDVLERVLKRFDREAKSLAKLTHPNIVNIIDYGEYEGSPYLVMPYLVGGTLKEQLGKPMSYHDAVTLLLPIADALGYAHQKGIVHRDIKPGNILITEGGAPMLTDFGIAQILEGGDSQTLTATGMGVGTPEYMSPEQAIGREVDGRTDIYSLGVVFFELVTGHRPYTADTPMAVILKQSTEPLPRPSQYVKDLPEEIEKILYKALAKKPEDRFQSMSEFQNALKSLGKNNSTDQATIQLVMKHLANNDEKNEKQADLTSDQGFLVSDPYSARTEKNPTKRDKTEKSNELAKRKLIWGISCFVLVLAAVGIYYLVFQTKNPNQHITNALLLTSTVQSTAISSSTVQTEVSKSTPEITAVPQFESLWKEGEVLFSDNFENGTATGWNYYDFWDVVKEESGNFVLQRQGPNYSEASILSGNDWQNYVFEARIKVVEPNTTDTYLENFDFIFREHDSSKYKWIVNEDNLNFGREPSWKGLGSTSYSFPVNTWFTMKIEVAGKTIRGFVDGIQFFEVTDANAIEYGTAGFSVSANTKVIFDDVKVIELIQSDNHNLTPTATVIEPSLGISSTQLLPKDGLTMGDPNAPLKVVMFADFQCPGCSSYWSTLEQKVIADYVETGKVFYTFSPFSFIGSFVQNNPYDESIKAAEATFCANDQGKFWEYRDSLFENQIGENQGAFSENNLLAFAKNLSLDMDAFTVCLQSGEHNQQVLDANNFALASGVNQTPSFTINGTLVTSGDIISAINEAIQ